MSSRRSRITALENEQDELLTRMIARERAGLGSSLNDTAGLRRLEELRADIASLERGQRERYTFPDKAPTIKKTKPPPPKGPKPKPKPDKEVESIELQEVNWTEDLVDGLTYEQRQQALDELDDIGKKHFDRSDQDVDKRLRDRDELADEIVELERREVQISRDRARTLESMRPEKPFTTQKQVKRPYRDSTEMMQDRQLASDRRLADLEMQELVTLQEKEMNLVDSELMEQLGYQLFIEDQNIHQRDGVDIKSEGTDQAGIDYLEDAHGQPAYKAPGYADEMYKRFKTQYTASKAQYAKQYPGEAFPTLNDQWERFKVFHARELGLSEKAVRAEFDELYPELGDTEFTSWMDTVPQARRTLGYQAELEHIPEDEELKQSQVDIDEQGPELGDLERLQSGGDYEMMRGSPIETTNLQAGLKRLKPEQRSALVSELGAADVMVGSAGKMFVNFAKSFAENALAAAAMLALGYAIPPQASKYINYAFDGWAVAELLTGNPGMAVITGGIELWKELNTQSKRQKYNIESDRDHGRKFGYVRDGNKWYPAFIKQHEKWHGGLGERGNDVDLVYGKHIVYKVLPGGAIEPELLNPIGIRHIAGSDKDLQMTGKDVALKDGLRDWYLLSPDDLQTVQKHGQTIVIPKNKLSVYKDDWSVYNVPPSREDGEPYLPPWWAANLDLRRSLDYMKHWSTGSAKLLGQHDTGIDPSLGLKHSSAMLPMDYDSYHGWPGDENYKISEHWGSIHERGTNRKYLLKTLLRQSIVALQKSQYMAAEEAGYDKETVVKVLGGIHDIAPVDWKQPTSQPWRAYVDYAKDLPEADGSDQLKDQLLKINEYKDRSLRQKSYLGNKAIVRYLMSTIEDRGGSDDLVKFLTKNSDHTEMAHTINSMKSEFGYEPEGAYADKFKYDKHGSNRYLNYVSSWSNKGETFLPSYVKPKNRKLLERVDDIEDLQKQNIKVDSPKDTSDRMVQLSQWQPGVPLPHKPPQDDKTLGVKEGKQARVRFVEPHVRTIDEIRMHYEYHGVQGLTKDEVNQFWDWAHKHPDENDAHKLFGDVTRAGDKYFNALVEKLGNNSPYMWDATKHKWVPRPGETKKPEPKVSAPKKDEEMGNYEKERARYRALELKRAREKEAKLKRERYSRGMSKEQWDHYLKSHNGMTPDEFEAFHKSKLGLLPPKHKKGDPNVKKDDKVDTGVKKDGKDTKKDSGWHVNIHGTGGTQVDPGSKKDDEVDTGGTQVDPGTQKDDKDTGGGPPHIDDILHGGTQVDHHVQVVHKAPPPRKIEHEQTWVHETVPDYKFEYIHWDEHAVARFEGRDFPQTSHSSVEQPRAQDVEPHLPIVVNPQST